MDEAKRYANSLDRALLSRLFEDPAVSYMADVKGLFSRILTRLEALETAATQTPSPASSHTTESATKDSPSAAPDSPTEVQTPLSQRLLGALTAAERTAVANSYGLQARLELFESWLRTLVPAVPGTTSTSARPG